MLDVNVKGTISIKSLDAEVAPDFENLLSRPPESWCWCVAWEVPTWDGWGDRTAEENRSLRRLLWVKGEYDGYVIYANDQPIGWIRVGPTSRWPKLASRGVELRDDLYIITCLGMIPEQRGRGLMRAAVIQVLTHLGDRGITEVAAIPKKFDNNHVADGEVWNGPERLYASLGFRQIREEKTFVEVRLLL